MSLPKEVEASYATIIDSILADSDLNTVSAKSIRKGLQTAVDYDITHQKSAINELIIARFDKFNAERATQTSSDVTPSMPASSGKDREPKSKVSEPVQTVSPPEEDDSGELSEVVDTPKKSPKKKRKAESVDDDAKFAAMLQAEENSRARRTRGTASGKANSVSRRKKKATKPKIRDLGESDMGSGSGEEKKRKVNRNGAFHKPMTLSAPLSELLGETTLSRPQTVSKIWAYVKERDLQDPKDKRHIRCDDAMRAVFKADKVHMFTMNKVLNQHLYKPDE
ncbi:hypothetical protein FGG08_003621 [Glutinoglossum americanum]|uniref:DM2 domain-containing protein n=1 Tax=Glutinoglossum americanum TaxID=1670608 RepID=A0A9P8L3G2_9PEZI|nr:hypothetical protein FGG08_003621 [Glutinoglossum americanum]